MNNMSGLEQPTRPRGGDARADEGRGAAYPRPPRPLDRVMVDEIMRELALLPAMRAEAAIPLHLPRFRPPPNPFQVPWAPGDPPLPWASGARGARRTSWLRWIVFALALGACVGVWVHKPTRARVAPHLHSTMHRTSAAVHQASAAMHRAAAHIRRAR
jgi:hypothetical protein